MITRPSVEVTRYTTPDQEILVSEALLPLITTGRFERPVLSNYLGSGFQASVDACGLRSLPMKLTRMTTENADRKTNYFLFQPPGGT